jgi:hypothetical protein
MSILTNWLNADLFSALRDKTNAAINAIKNTAPGVAGNILRYQSSTDYDYVPTSEFAYKCVAASSSTSVTNNNVSVAFTVPAALQFGVGNRVRATGSAGNWIEGIVTAYSSTTLTVLVDRINGIGSFTSWTINISDGISESLTQTTSAETTTSISGVTIATEAYKFNYRVINKLMYLDFSLVLTITTGATVSELLLSLPDGITKDETGASSGYLYYGHAFYSSNGTTTKVPCQISNYDDGSEGQRIRLVREEDDNFIIGNGNTITIRGNIIMPIL